MKRVLCVAAIASSMFFGNAAVAHIPSNCQIESLNVAVVMAQYKKKKDEMITKGSVSSAGLATAFGEWLKVEDKFWIALQKWMKCIRG